MLFLLIKLLLIIIDINLFRLLQKLIQFKSYLDSF